MTARQRLVVIRLFDGKLFRTPQKPVTFTAEGAYRFLAALKPKYRDYGDTLHGASVEMLPKRGQHPAPIEGQALDGLIARMKSRRILAQAESLERQAEGYRFLAHHALESAARLRAEAATLRATITDGDRAQDLLHP